MEKVVLIHERAEKELSKFPREVRLKFKALFEILETNGRLEMPFAKKLLGENDLFEIRVKYRGQWRAIYAYVLENEIIILSAFVKKTQKTPLKELNTSRNRLKEYMGEI